MTRRVLWLALLCFGCSEGVSEVSKLEYARVLGVRVEAASDSEQASVRVDEEAIARVLVAGPDGAAEVSSAMVLCPAEAPDGTLPTCSGPVLASALADATTEPTLTWSGLSADDLGGAEGLLVAGTICEQGAPSIDGMRPGQCDGSDTPGVSYVAHVSMRDADDATTDNQHPRLIQAEVSLDGAAWNEGDCGARASRDHREHDVAVTLHDSNRETIDGNNEQLLLSWFTTDGDLDRHFSVLERDAPEDTPLDAVWTSPKTTADVTRNVVTFTFVLRDQRGGIDWTQRTLCLE